MYLYEKLLTLELSAAYLSLKTPELKFLCRKTRAKAVPMNFFVIGVSQHLYRGGHKSLYPVQVIIIELGKVTYGHPCISTERVTQR